MSVVVGKRYRRKEKNRKTQFSNNSVQNLGILLKNFGVKNSSKGLHLLWGTSDESQFDFLLKLMSQLTNINLYGTYKSGEWIISA